MRYDGKILYVSKSWPFEMCKKNIGAAEIDVALGSIRVCRDYTKQYVYDDVKR